MLAATATPPTATAEEIRTLETLLDEEMLGWAAVHYVIIRCIWRLDWTEFKTREVLRAAERTGSSRLEIVRRPGGPYVRLAP